MHRASIAAERIVQFCAVLLMLGFLASGSVYLYLASWSVTQQDYWRIYDICLNHSWLQSAVLKFNGHSLFFPSFIWLADLRFFHGRQEVLFFASFALLVTSTSLLLVPIWRDRTVTLTARILATLTVIVGSFWVGRASITASGGFNCMASFVMLGAALAFLVLSRMRPDSSHLSQNAIALIGAGFLASFSFGTGLGIWPCLLLLGWCFRLPGRVLALITAGAITAALIFHFLPPPEPSYFVATRDSPGIASTIALGQLCKLVGGPVFYSVVAWQGKQATTELILSSPLLLWTGAAGLVLAAIVTLPHLIRRDLQRTGLEFIGLALVSFNLFALILILAGRVAHFHRIPGEVGAPRYLFWSSLFWAGLILMAIGFAERRRSMRWPCVLLVFAAPVLGWREHCDEGLHWRYAKLLSEECATSLINGVNDPQRMLAPEVGQINILAPQLRAHRLDMFEAGLQDWIGQPVSSLVGGHLDRHPFRGEAVMERLAEGADPAGAVRVTGRIFGKNQLPATMVIVDSQGTVAGIARSFPTNRFLNHLLYRDLMPRDPLTGYIRNYRPALQYAIHFAGKKGISKQTIKIVAPPPQAN